MAVAEISGYVGQHQSFPKTEKVQNHLVTLLELRALPEKKAPAIDASAVAKGEKKGVLYRDAGVEEGKNWLGMALDRLRNLKFNLDAPKINAPKAPVFGPWLSVLLWCVLIGAVVAFAYYGIRHIDWKRTLARKSKAVLEEDEPERSLDEWLTAADQLANEGRYREAVRALYLACLLRFDYGRVARFDRRQTNWEHLARIETSPRAPAGIDFRTPTKAFDNIWYGFRTDGMTDVVRFRDWYHSITKAVMEVPK